MYLVDDLIAVAKHDAIELGLDPELICAIITIESSWRCNSARYEPGYQWLFQPKKFAKLHGVDEKTEACFQSTSWGILQLMGANARELGFNGWLPDLTDLETGLYWGLEYFVKNCAKYKDVRDQLAAWNGGGKAVRNKVNGVYSNQKYVDKVLALLRGGNGVVL